MILIGWVFTNVNYGRLVDQFVCWALQRFGKLIDYSCNVYHFQSEIEENDVLQMNKDFYLFLLSCAVLSSSLSDQI